MTILYFLLAGLIGYLCGSVPFGFLYVKMTKGVDIRDIGSGRTGGTNSLRAAGVTVGFITSISDVLKGMAGVMLTRLLFGQLLDASLLPWAVILAGIFSVVGHNWSIFLKFGGGAGTGPNVGWGTALWWPMFPIGFLVMVGLLLSIGMASIASMAMAIVIPVAFLILYLSGVEPYDDTIAYIVGGTVTASIVAWALRANFKRVLNGTERVAGPRAKK